MDKIKIKNNQIYHESAGGYVFFNDSQKNVLYVAILKKEEGYFIPKGHVKEKETPEQASLREIKEELRIKSKLRKIGKVGINKYKFFMMNDDKAHCKKVHLYVYLSEEKSKIKPLKKEDFLKAEWVSVTKAKEKITFDKENLQKAINLFRSKEKKTKKINEDIIKSFSKALKENLFAIISDGSLAFECYDSEWSDIDLVLVAEKNNFKAKQKIARVKQILEKKYKKHLGINVISREEFQKPINPVISLDGKTLQALLELSKFPKRLIFCKKIIKFYIPSKKEIRKYSISNILMFLLRGRRDLTSREFITREEYKKITEKQIRASFTIAKLAIQYFTFYICENKEDIVRRASKVFPNFRFHVLKDNLIIIKDWKRKRTASEYKNLLKRTDLFIESFSKYIIEKIRNQ